MRADLANHFGISNPTLAATCATSLSPRPERFTMMSCVLAHLRRAHHDFGDGVGAFQRGDDAFQPREFHEGFERLVVGGVGVFDAALRRAARRVPGRRRRNRVRR